jgi:hypothetical protein
MGGGTWCRPFLCGEVDDLPYRRARFERGKALVDLAELDPAEIKWSSFSRPCFHSDNSRGMSTRKRLPPIEVPWILRSRRKS